MQLIPDMIMLTAFVRMDQVVLVKRLFLGEQQRTLEPGKKIASRPA
jgi:hypothetical protein